MKKPEIGDWVFTNNDLGIVTKIGIGYIEMDNNVNIYKVKTEDIQDVI